MAIPTGSGTETIHSVLMEDVSATTQTLITGVKHHIYTILSITLRTVGVHSTAGSNNDVNVYLTGYDSVAGASGENINLLNYNAVNKSTFVWNDKFSFFGYEPSSNTQLARAAQGSNTPQYLKIETGSTDCKVDVTCTFIDQDWS